MSYSISYGIDTLTSIESSNNIIYGTLNVNGISIVDTSFNLELNYSDIPVNITVSYSITAIRIE